MASHGVSGGLGGSVQTASAIWRQDGLRGFYRGFGTVVFGTIPGRTVYLTTLELTKDAIQRNEALIHSMAPTALAGTANFVAGGAASLVTQLVAVPVDVVSQRLMVHGADLGTPSSSGSGGGSGSGGMSSSGGRSGGGGGGAASSASSSSSTSSSGGGGGGGGSGSVAGVSKAAHDGVQGRRGYSTWTGGVQGAWRSQVLAPLREQLQAGVLLPEQQQQAQHQQRPCMAQAQRMHLMKHGPLRLYSSSSSSSGGGGGGAMAAAAVGAGHPRMNGFQMARLIVHQEGLRGLWRGLLPSAALYVPNSAIWWGCYGGWQSLIWLTLHPDAAGGSSADEHQPAAATSVAAAASKPGEVVAVQTAAAALAGACSAVLTTPLDVLKTRLQVSGGNGGSAGPSASGGANWSGILRELLREEGVRGLWRGLAPRMASSSIFGVCMTVTYQALKRWCAITE